MLKQDAPADLAPIALSREEILRATARCLQSEGYDGTTIRRIAAELGCAVGSIYRYFQDKRELLFTVTQQAMAPAAQMVDAGAGFPETVLTYHRLATADPGSYRLMFWLASMVQPQSPMPPVIARIVEGWAAKMHDAGAAHRCWQVLHGSIMMGMELAPTWTAVASLNKSADGRTAPAPASEPTPAHAPPAPRAAASVATNPPVPPRLEPVIIQLTPPLPAPSSMRAHVVEDVCLL